MAKDLSKTKFFIEFQDYIECVMYWQSILNIENWSIFCISISENQVVDELHNNTTGHEFVGVEINTFKKVANLYHTRPLFEDDIVHELLHVRFPEWEEEKVVLWTDKLQNAFNPKDLIDSLLVIT